jgi:hypothetical protein
VNVNDIPVYCRKRAELAPPLPLTLYIYWRISNTNDVGRNLGSRGEREGGRGDGAGRWRGGGNFYSISARAAPACVVFILTLTALPTSARDT